MDLATKAVTHITKPKQKTRDPLLDQLRIREQEDYLERLRTRFTAKSKDKAVLASLFRTNGLERSFFEELDALNVGIAPMKQSCKLTLLMPAAREGRYIKNTLLGWLNQYDVRGKPIDPDLYEIIVLVNRPSESVAWDKTAKKVRQFAKKHRHLNIHLLQHSFNFPEEPIEIKVDGKTIDIGRGVRMGLVFRMLSDIALMRNLRRQGSERASHLIHPTGADVYSRNPLFLEEAFAVFSRQETEFLKLKFALPAGICTHMPLLWALHRYRMALANEFFQRRQLKRHGVFRAGTYARVGGFSPTASVGEDTDFGFKIVGAGASIAECADTVVIDNPRRSLTTIIDGKKLIEEYAGFGIKDGAVKEFSIAHFLSQKLPPEAVFSRENFAFHASAHFRTYIRKALRKNDFEHAFEIAKESARKALLETGFEERDFEIVRGKTVPECHIGIDSGERMGQLFVDYANQERPKWME